MTTALDTLRKAAKTAQLKADLAMASLAEAEKENEPKVDRLLVRLAQKKRSGLIVLALLTAVSICSMVLTVKLHLGC